MAVNVKNYCLRNYLDADSITDCERRYERHAAGLDVILLKRRQKWD